MKLQKCWWVGVIVLLCQSAQADFKVDPILHQHQVQFQKSKSDLDLQKLRMALEEYFRRFGVSVHLPSVDSTELRISQSLSHLAPSKRQEILFNLFEPFSYLFPKLERLDLTENGLENMPPNSSFALSRLSELKTVDLSKNQFRRLPGHLFRVSKIFEKRGASGGCIYSQLC